MLAIYVFLFLLSFAVSLTVIHKVLKWSVLEGLVASFSSAAVFATLCIPFFKRRWGRAGTKGVTGGLLIIALAFSAFAFGANDMGNATGAFVTPTRAIMGIPTMNVMFILSLLGAVGIAIGGFTWGHRVIKTSGFKITRLNPITGLSAEYSNALTILLFTVVPKYLTGFGLPISTTHSSIGSIMGVGLAQGGFASVNKFMTAKVLLTWALTIPCTALLSITFFKVFTVLLPLEA
jgi:phosphate/sulfate permease